MIMDISLEHRQKIADLLHRMAPGEFEKRNLDIPLNKKVNDVEGFSNQSSIPYQKVQDICNN